MPLPTPKKNENKQSFIDRCMGDDVMTTEYEDQSQRRAVCESQWGQKDMNGFEIKCKGTMADILIYEDIGDGWLGGISAKTFADELKKLKNLTQLNVRINSPGGAVFDGLAIYNTLKKHKANVTVSIDGLAASIASVIAMAGDQITMAENALMMIHDP